MEPLDRFSRNFWGRSSWLWLAQARTSSGGVAIRYVLPVSRMTLRLAVVGSMAICVYTTSGVAIPGRSLMSMNALFPVALRETILL